MIVSVSLVTGYQEGALLCHWGLHVKSDRFRVTGDWILRRNVQHVKYGTDEH